MAPEREERRLAAILAAAMVGYSGPMEADERTVDDLWHRIGTLLDALPPDECRNYFRHAGYAQY